MTDNHKPIRRVRILQYALFGAFVYSYFGVLLSERLMAGTYALMPAFTTRFLLGFPHFFGLLALFIFLPLLIFCNKRWQLFKRCGSLTRQVLYLTLLFVVVGLIPVADEQTILELRTARLIALHKEDEALEVGRRYVPDSPRLQMLRLRALGTIDRMAGQFFALPGAYHPFSDRIVAERLVNTPIGNGGYAYLREGDSIFSVPPAMTALLDGNLDRFAGTIPNVYLSEQRVEKIPVALRQALVLYVRLTTHPILDYTDEATEANYRDFVNRRDSIRKQYPRDVKNAAKAERNLMAEDFYGTYWFYYFYECPDRKFGL